MMESLDQVTQRLADWVGSVLPDIAAAGGVRIGPDAEDGAPAQGAVVRLTGIGAAARPSDAAAPLALSLRYGVALRLATRLEEHRALGELAFAALASPAYEIVALDVEAPGGPALTLATTLARPREVVRAPRVRRPLRALLEPAAPLEGVVLGPGGVPVAAATVGLAGEPNGAVATDAAGRFVLPLAAAPPGYGLRLRVEARGGAFLFTAPPGETARAPLTLRLPLEG